ncbi:HIT family protein [Terasakiella sp. A23]|uniref:HIT family protein n=1 Tax=Terasakiella sp. FCG-A23 TaxID=3080561 RepID=UPI002953DC2F|nr:HIT family protein [Terasakiella sp. A23]MDV7340296.1 HIT family protein [Terasakiella sp. A23]
MFKLNERIDNDTFEICELSACKLLLMNDQNYPWILLVPMFADVTELHHLSIGDQTKVLADINQASQIMEDMFKPKSLNVAALGNVVSQLHIHIVARFEDDATWPGPVWGQKPAIPYDDEKRLNQLKDAFK